MNKIIELIGAPTTFGQKKLVLIWGQMLFDMLGCYLV